MVCNVGYHVCKVKKSTNHKSSYLNQFLDPESTGKYIAWLYFSNDNEDHYVGIDCDNHLIWDTIEEYVMDLTLENLHYCAGKPGITLEKIVVAYKFQNNKKKRKSINKEAVMKKSMKKWIIENE